jgi:tetratricopeptide (TPR) repeat protein
MSSALGEKVPGEVTELADALRRLAGWGGLSDTRLLACSPLLSCVRERHPDVAESAIGALAIELLEGSLKKINPRRDRDVLRSAINLDHLPGNSWQKRVVDAVAAYRGTAQEQDAETAIDRCRKRLFLTLAFIILGRPQANKGRIPKGGLELASSLVASNRRGEARGVLRQLVVDEQVTRTDRSEASRMLAQLALEADDLASAERYLACAVELSETDASYELVLTLRRYVSRQLDEGREDAANRVVVRGLTRFLHNGHLWMRLGITHWYAGKLIEAYAMMTTAEIYGHPREAVVHARGQVLAELGIYESAIAELDEALSVPRSEISEAYARSTRAFAIGMSGDLARASREFDAAEAKTPDNAWLHYFKGLCYFDNTDMDNAVRSLARALEATAPPLTVVKRVRATAVLAEICATNEH